MTIKVYNSFGRTRNFKKAASAIQFYREVKQFGGSAMIEHKVSGRTFGTM